MVKLLPPVQDVLLQDNVGRATVTVASTGLSLVHWAMAGGAGEKVKNINKTKTSKGTFCRTNPGKRHMEKFGLRFIDYFLY
ncbi:MAG: hypothetical protein MI747_14720 [Desulfobacterales bacterium]|nr:hypothetical protein [Desulfobacterales bacterium]